MRSINITISDGTGAATLLQAQDAPTHHMDGTCLFTQPSNDFKRTLPIIKNSAEEMKNREGNLSSSENV